MSIWDGIAMVGKAAHGTVQKKTKSIQKYRDQYASLSDKQLVEKFKNSSGDQKFACAALLKERGLID